MWFFNTLDYQKVYSTHGYTIPVPAHCWLQGSSDNSSWHNWKRKTIYKGTKKSWVVYTQAMVVSTTHPGAWTSKQTLPIADWCSITTSPHLKKCLGHLKPSKSWQAWNKLSALRKLMGTYEVQTSNQLSLFNLGQTWGKPRSTQGLSFRKSPELGYPIYKWKMSFDYWS